MIAYGVHESGRREVIGLDVGEAETESLLARVPARPAGPRPGRRAPVRLRRPPGPARTRSARCWAAPGSAAPCTSSATCSATSPGRSSRWSSAAIRQVFRRLRRRGARARWPRSSTRLPSHAPKVARLLRGRRGRPAGLLRASQPSTGPSCARTNPLERVNREIGRRSDVVGHLPQRRRAAAPGRDAADRAERRVAGQPPDVATAEKTSAGCLQHRCCVQAGAPPAPSSRPLRTTRRRLACRRPRSANRAKEHSGRAYTATASRRCGPALSAVVRATLRLA